MFERQAIDDFKEHAQRVYPHEACGFIVSGDFVAAENAAANPEETFIITPQAWGAAQRHGSIEAVVHSHPDGLDAPSRADMEQQAAMAVPWGICVTTKDDVSEPFFFGDQLPVEPIFGANGDPNPKRFFRHGVWDCYSLIRDYYRLHRGIILRDFPRDWEWWEGDEAMYETGFPLAGFKQVQLAAIQEGDVLLGKTSNAMKQVNHGGVYIGGPYQQFVHHLTAEKAVDKSRPIRVSSVVTWRKHITYCLRYVGEGDALKG